MASEAPGRRSSSRALRVLCHVGVRRGIGHLTRQATLVRALREIEPSAEAIFHLKVEDRHVLRPDEPQYVMGEDARGPSLSGMLDHSPPDLLLFDTLLPKEPPPPESLGAPRPSAVLTLRKVRPERLDRILENRWMDWVRLILVPHEKEEFDFVRPERPGLRTLFVGAIIAHRPPADLDVLSRRYGIRRDDLLVVATLGGGGVPQFAHTFTSSVVAAFRWLRQRVPSLRLILVTGPKNADPLASGDGGQGSEPGLTLVPFEADLPDLFRLARIVIAQGGYNSTHEIVRAGTPALFLPCPCKYDDGVGRAKALVARGVAYLVEDADPHAVAEILLRFFEDPTEEAAKRAALARIALQPGNGKAARALLDLAREHRREIRSLGMTLGPSSGVIDPPVRSKPWSGAEPEAQEAAQAVLAPAGSPFRLPVVSYHLVDPTISDRWSVTPEAFEAQLDWLDVRARVIGLPEALALFDAGEPAPPGAVVLTFDDGYESFLDHARPALLRRGMTAALFLITRFMGRENKWNSRARYLARHLSWEQAKELVTEGFEPGAHGRTHQALVKFDRKRIKSELHGAAQDIEEALGHEARFVAYPYGSHDKVVTSVARKRFRFGFASGTKGVRDWREDPFRIHRIVVGPHLSLAAFASLVHGYAEP